VQMRGSREDAKARILPDIVRLLDAHAESVARGGAA